MVKLKQKPMAAFFIYFFSVEACHGREEIYLHRGTHELYLMSGLTSELCFAFHGTALPAPWFLCSLTRVALDFESPGVEVPWPRGEPGAITRRWNIDAGSFSQPISNINRFVCPFILTWVDQHQDKANMGMLSLFNPASVAAAPILLHLNLSYLVLTSSMGYVEKQMYTLPPFGDNQLGGYTFPRLTDIAPVSQSGSGTWRNTLGKLLASPGGRQSLSHRKGFKNIYLN